jgi:uncharacterized protein
MEAIIQNNSRTQYMMKAILFCAVFTGIFIVFSFAKSFIPDNVERLAHGIIGTLAAFLTTGLFLKFDRKRFADIGLKFQPNTIPKFFTGVIAGIGVMGLLATSVLYFTNAVIAANPNSNLLNFLVMTLPLLPLAFMEELGFRAYPLEILKDKTGVRLSIIITSLLFALYHIANGWTIAGSFLGPGVWGLVFGLAAVYSRGIALPTGLHYAANLTISAFGGSGNTVSLWTVQQSVNAPAKQGGIDWITILPALALLVLAIACIELYLRRKNTPNTAPAKTGPANDQSPIV